MHTFSVLTKLLTFATILHVYLIILKEYASVRKEHREALYVHADTCSDPVKRMKYGRFHSCDDVDEMLAVSSLVLTAMDRAFLRFFNALKHGTIQDLNHMGMLVLTLSLVAVALSYAVSTAYKIWAYHSLQRKYGETMKQRKTTEQGEKHIAIKMYKHD